ncbi:hypothetical protein P3T43_006901 [Paraburkholderia sp. GAS41]
MLSSERNHPRRWRLKIPYFGKVIVCLTQNKLEARGAHTPISRIGPKLWNFDTGRSRDEIIVAAIAFAEALDGDPFGAAVGTSN